MDLRRPQSEYLSYPLPRHAQCRMTEVCQPQIEAGAEAVSLVIPRTGWTVYLVWARHLCLPARTGCWRLAAWHSLLSYEVVTVVGLERRSLLRMDDRACTLAYRWEVASAVHCPILRLALTVMCFDRPDHMCSRMDCAIGAQKVLMRRCCPCPCF